MAGIQMVLKEYIQGALLITCNPPEVLPHRCVYNVGVAFGHPHIFHMRAPDLAMGSPPATGDRTDKRDGTLQYVYSIMISSATLMAERPVAYQPGQYF